MEKSNAILIIGKYILVGKKIFVNEDEAQFRKYYFDFLNTAKNSLITYA